MNVEHRVKRKSGKSVQSFHISNDAYKCITEMGLVLFVNYVVMV